MIWDALYLSLICNSMRQVRVTPLGNCPKFCTFSGESGQQNAQFYLESAHSHKE